MIEFCLVISGFYVWVRKGNCGNFIIYGCCLFWVIIQFVNKNDFYIGMLEYVMNGIFICGGKNWYRYMFGQYDC